MYFLGNNNTILIKREFYIIINLSINILIRVDIFKPKDLMI